MSHYFSENGSVTHAITGKCGLWNHTQYAFTSSKSPVLLRTLPLLHPPALALSIANSTPKETGDESRKSQCQDNQSSQWSSLANGALPSICHVILGLALTTGLRPKCCREYTARIVPVLAVYRQNIDQIYVPPIFSYLVLYWRCVATIYAHDFGASRLFWGSYLATHFQDSKSHCISSLLQHFYPVNASRT